MRFDLPDGEEVEFISLSQVHEIHENYALAPNNPRGLLDEGKLQSAVARPEHVFHYSDERPDLITLSAYTWHGISEAHGYEDGNKRTALIAGIVFLNMNGVDYQAPEFDVGRFIWRLYDRNLFKVAVLDEYLRRYCRWIE